MSEAKKKLRQAVVVIHGMGEHRPMDFLRGFVDAALAIPEGEAKATYYSKPDRMSELFELRRYLAPPSSANPQTELYEYYWSYHMRGNKVWHLLPLLRALMPNWPWNLSARLRWLWAALWLVTLGIGYAAVIASPEQGASGVSGLLVALGVKVSVAAVLAALAGLALRFIVRSFGDVARYLNPDPGNVAIRQKIRSEAVNLLRSLQESDKYHRIVVVGHSLGSFVGLDALNHLWIEQGHKYADLAEGEDVPAQEALAALEAAAEDLAACESTGRGLVEARDAYSARQRELWQELRRLGSPWRITDFVSVGSPLAHAPVLLGSASQPVRELQRRYELPRCPPEWELKKNKRRGFAFPLLDAEPKPDAKPEKLRTLHTGACFAPTRWTNIWFPSPLGLFGDIFAGPLAPHFGAGVIDQPVTSSKLARYLPVAPHSLYFKWTDEADQADSAVGALRAAIDLRSWKWARVEPDAERDDDEDD